MWRPSTSGKNGAPEWQGQEQDVPSKIKSNQDVQSWVRFLSKKHSIISSYRMCTLKQPVYLFIFTLNFHLFFIFTWILLVALSDTSSSKHRRAFKHSVLCADHIGQSLMFMWPNKKALITRHLAYRTEMPESISVYFPNERKQTDHCVKWWWWGLCLNVTVILISGERDRQRLTMLIIR